MRSGVRRPRSKFVSFAQSPAALDSGRYQRFAEFLKEQKLIAEAPPVESYAVQLW